MKIFLTFIMSVLICFSAFCDPLSTSTSNVINAPSSSDGYQVGSAATSKVGFFGATPIVQPTDASQSAFTDSSGGTASDTLAAGIGISTLVIPITALSDISANGDVVTTFTPGYKFKILGLSFLTSKPVTTGSKAATVNLEIGSTDLTGGSLSLTSAGLTPLGKIVEASAITANNEGLATSNISLEATGVTAFVEGSGAFIVKIQNMDVAAAWAAVADKWNQIRTDMVNLGLIKGE